MIPARKTVEAMKGARNRPKRGQKVAFWGGSKKRRFLRFRGYPRFPPFFYRKTPHKNSRKVPKSGDSQKVGYPPGRRNPFTDLAYSGMRKRRKRTKSWKSWTLENPEIRKWPKNNDLFYKNDYSTKILLLLLLLLVNFR